MKVDAKNINGIVKNGYSGALIYGPDVGMVRERKRELLECVMPDYKTNLSLINITPTMVRDDANILKNEFNTMSLFGNMKVILLELPEETERIPIHKYLENLFADKKQDNKVFLITTAGNLDAKSALRKFGECNINIACIACYNDSKEDIAEVIKEKLKDFRYSGEVAEYLIESFGGDRGVILAEIEKLIVYKGNNKTISKSDVITCIQDNSMADMNDFVNAVANLDTASSFIELRKLYSEDIYPVVIIRSLINYFMKLQLYKYKMQKGADVNELVAHEFWKQRTIMKKQLIKLSLNNINNMLEYLLAEEIRAKRGGGT